MSCARSHAYSCCGSLHTALALCSVFDKLSFCVYIEVEASAQYVFWCLRKQIHLEVYGFKGQMMQHLNVDPLFPHNLCSKSILVKVFNFLLSKPVLYFRENVLEFFSSSSETKIAQVSVNT